METNGNCGSEIRRRKRDSRNSETQTGPLNGEMFVYVRLCSPMFAFNRKKIVEAPDGERSSILQNARQTGMGTRVTRPSEYQRQSRRERALDFGRARWVRGNAGRMNGNTK